jgi:hypothetical protein
MYASRGDKLDIIPHPTFTVIKWPFLGMLETCIVLIVVCDGMA